MEVFKSRVSMLIRVMSMLIWDNYELDYMGYEHVICELDFSIDGCLR